MFRQYFVIFIPIIMCPRKSYPLTTHNSNAGAKTATNFGDNKEYNPNKEEFPYYPHQNKNPPSQWVGDTMNSDVNKGARLDKAEPGFDLTAEDKAKFKIWPQGIIPYYIEHFSFDQGFRDMLTSFLTKASSLTGLHFVELQNIPTHDVRFVFFINRRGVLECQDYTTENFTNNGVQKVVLGYDCFSDGEGPGSLILALAGVPPMHRAPDRDQYLTFSPANTIPDKIHLFDILSDKDWIFHDFAYDWHSAGHYIWHMYTTNGHATIAPKKKAPLKTGEFKKLSKFDLQKIKMLYKYALKKSQHVKKPQCNKLFRPGSNLAAYNPKNNEELTPRVKPDAVQEKSDDSKVNTIEAGSHNDPIVGKNVDSEKNRESKPTPLPDSKRVKLYGKKNIPTQDPIWELSDFNSEEIEDRVMNEIKE